MLRVIPPDQRLQSGKGLSGKVDLWLIEQFKFVIRECPGQFFLDLDSLQELVD
ncbi:hypothetical protein D3C73_1493490 [compost metagenome]